MKDDNSRKMVVITGCDSGMGKNLAELCLAKGHPVCISYCEVDPLPGESGLFSYKMDLRDETQIIAFADECTRVASMGYKLHALINNAGIALGGPVENVPMRIFRDVMEVNFFGLVNLTQRMIPLLIRDRGTLLIHGSMAGRIALPFLSPYASSKFALEGLADSLRRELSPLGIKTVLLETAGVATPIWKKARNMDINIFDPKYLPSLNLFLEKFVDTGNLGLDSMVAAQRIYHIIMKKNPRARYIIAKSVLLSRMEMIIPSRILDRILAKLFGMNYGA